MYMAVQGGWANRETLGSRSSEIAIRAGDELLAPTSRTPGRTTSLGILDFADSPIRFLDGPDAASLSHASLESTPYKVSGDSNRMGVRVEGEPIRVASPDSRLSSPVAPGTIQIAGGLPIVLGPACGTMGGYPHVGQVISADLDRIGQLRPGSIVRFQKVALDEARAIDRSYRACIRDVWLQLSVACRQS
jgi:allophanate hydrolase subunit 2